MSGGRGAVVVTERSVLEGRGYRLGEGRSSRLGSGRYSKVRRAQRVGDGVSVAVKIVDLGAQSDNFWERFLQRELRILESVRHPSITALLEHFRVGRKVFVILELAPAGDLLRLIQAHGAQTEEVGLGWTRQLLGALQYLHARRIAHRDLKLENVLVADVEHIKLADFTFTRRMDATEELSSTYCGSKAYSCPQILSSNAYNPFKADVFALGVIVYIVLVGRMPFNERVGSRAAIVEQHRSRHWAATLAQTRVSAEAKAAVEWMLAFAEASRPSAAQLAAQSLWLTVSAASTDVASERLPDATLVDTSLPLPIPSDSNYN